MSEVKVTREDMEAAQQAIDGTGTLISRSRDAQVGRVAQAIANAEARVRADVAAFVKRESFQHGHAGADVVYADDLLSHLEPPND